MEFWTLAEMEQSPSPLRPPSQRIIICGLFRRFAGQAKGARWYYRIPLLISHVWQFRVSLHCGIPYLSSNPSRSHLGELSLVVGSGCIRTRKTILRDNDLVIAAFLAWEEGADASSSLHEKPHGYQKKERNTSIVDCSCAIVNPRWTVV